jgi:hypothetical protein
MKLRALLLIGLTFLIQKGFSQITLTVNDIANVGDQIISTSIPYTGESPAVGAAQNYDLTQLPPGFLEDTTNYIAAAGTPYASQMPGANICQVSAGSYTYFVRNSGGFYLKGFVFAIPPGSGLPLPSEFVFSFSPQIPIMTFPATMGMNLNTDATSSRVEIPFDTTIVISGVPTNIDKIGIKLNMKDTSVIDGWGTANFPGGQYEVLRNTHSINLSTTLEAYVIIFGTIGTWIPLPTSLIPGGAGDFLGGNTKDVMLWANGRKQPMVTMSLDTLGLVISADVQADLLVVSNRSLVSEIPTFEFYPNPANSSLTFTLPEDTRKIRIRDVSGRLLQVFQNFGTVANLSVESLPEGVHIAEIETSSGQLSRKRIVIKH